MAYKFEQLEVWKLALDYIDLIYALAKELPIRHSFLIDRRVHATSSGLPSAVRK